MHLINTPKTKSTVKSIVALEFAAVKEFRGCDKAKRLTKSHNMIERLRPMLVLAVELMALTKPELVEKLESEEGHAVFGPFLMQLADAADTAKAVHELLHSAELRLASALAVVEGY
jgi:hypothetical protein